MDDRTAVLGDWMLEHGWTEAHVKRVMMVLAEPSIEASWWSKPPQEDGDGVILEGGRRCGVYRHWPDWFVGYSPRNGLHASVEGSLSDWVELAQNIIAAAAVKPELCPKPGQGAGGCQLTEGHEGECQP